MAGSATSLTVTVPLGATYQNISVTDLSAGLTAYSAKPFTVTYENGVLSYQPQVVFDNGPVPYSVAVGDLNGDGKPDLAVANADGNTVSIFRNTATPGGSTAATFANRVDIATGTWPTSVAIGDLDGDGKPDLAVTVRTSNVLSVYRNISTSGSLTLESFAAGVDFATGTAPLTVAIADLDIDGKPDLAIINQTNNTLSIIRNTTTSGSITAASFAPKVDFSTGSNPYGIAIGDLDGDGKPDIAVANVSGSAVSIYRNTTISGSITTTSFTNKIDIAAESPRAVAIADIDGDGKSDLIVSNVQVHTLSIYRSIATPGVITTASFGAKVSFATGNSPGAITIADLDGDNKPDVALVNVQSNLISVYRNTATLGSITSTSLSTKTDFLVGGNPFGIASGDLTEDGKSDLAVVSNQLGLSILRNGLIQPTISAINLTFTNTTATGTSVTWVNGNGANRAVFIAAADGSPLPVDGITYTANTAFGLGTQIGTSGWYCVYNGTGTTVDITGLTLGTTYRVMAVEYNGNGINTAYFNTATRGNPANVTARSINALSTVGLTSSTPAMVAFSLRNLSSTYTGPAIKVRRSSDNALQDINFTNGVLDTVSLKTFVGTGNGYVTVWYDQSGNGLNAVQATVTNQPRIVNAGFVDNDNGIPRIYFGAGADVSLAIPAASVSVTTGTNRYIGFVGKIDTYKDYGVFFSNATTNNFSLHSSITYTTPNNLIYFYDGLTGTVFSPSFTGTSQFMFGLDQTTGRVNGGTSTANIPTTTTMD